MNLSARYSTLSPNPVQGLPNKRNKLIDVLAGAEAPAEL